MRKKIYILIWIALFSAGSGAFALSLEEALSLAMENNISLKREEIILGAAERTSRHSWNSLLPSVSVGVNDELSLQEGLQNNFGLEGKVSVTVSPDFLLSIKKAQADYDAARISYEQAVSEILSQIKEAYFSLLYEKQNLDYLYENLENAKKQAEQNKERYRLGTLSELEYLSSKVAYEKLKPELKGQELSFQNNFKSFSLLLGLDNSENQLALEGSLEDFISKYTAFFDSTTKEAVLADITNGNIPSVQALKKQIEASQKELERTKLSVLGPSVNLSYSINPILAGAEKNQIKQAASVGFSLPLENWLPCSQGADSIKAAQDSVTDLQLQLKEKTKAVNAEFSSIINDLEQKEETLVSLRDYIQLAQKTYDAALFSYSKGTMEFLSMQNAAKENLEAKLSLQNELLEKLKLYISLEKLCGKTLPLGGNYENK